MLKASYPENRYMRKSGALFLDAEGEDTDCIREKYRSNDDDDELEKRD